MTDTPTLGRPESFRTAYASAMQDVEALRITVTNDTETILQMQDLLQADRVALKQAWYERDAATARADAAEAEVGRLKALIHDRFIYTFQSQSGDGASCYECGNIVTEGGEAVLQHDAGCIVVEARQAQKEAAQ